MLIVVSFILAAGLRGQELDRRAIVTASELPLYPPVAVSARLEGTVVVTVRVTNGAIQQAEPTSGSDPLLASAARRNILSWRFAPETSGTFDVQFVYDLEEEEVMVPENPEIYLRLPELVRIVAKPVKALTVGK